MEFANNITLTTSPVTVDIDNLVLYGIDPTWLTESSGELTIKYLGQYLVNAYITFSDNNDPDPETKVIMTLRYGSTNLVSSSNNVDNSLSNPAYFPISLS